MFFCMYTMESSDKEPHLDPTLLYKVSHNLRGPLNSIIGLANLGLNEASVQDTKSAFYFEKIKVSAERLNRFIDELIQFSKITIVNAADDKIYFQNMLDTIVSSLQFLDNFKKINFNINVQQYSDFYSDSGVLYSIMQNIIENSIKYCDVDKPYRYISIKIKVHNERTKIEIEDNGIGIDEAHIDKITDMFVRATDKSTGNGIGLFIVRKSVEKLGGSMAIHSKLGIGTTTVIIFENSKPKY